MWNEANLMLQKPVDAHMPEKKYGINNMAACGYIVDINLDNDLFLSNSMWNVILCEHCKTEKIEDVKKYVWTI
jgi:hypothetical protein